MFDEMFSLRKSKKMSCCEVCYYGMIFGLMCCSKLGEEEFCWE